MARKAEHKKGQAGTVQTIQARSGYAFILQAPHSHAAQGTIPTAGPSSKKRTAQA